MSFRALLPALLLLAPLMGQESHTITYYSSGSDGKEKKLSLKTGPEQDPQSWKGFLLTLRTQSAGAILVLEGNPPLLSAQIQKLSEQEPALELDLPLRIWAPSHPLARELRQRNGWGPEGHWVFLDPQGRPKAAGTAGPKSSIEWAGTLLGAGYRSQAQVLEGFLKVDPERLDVRASLVRERWKVASKRYRALIGKAPRPLTEKEDGRLFGAFARELKTLLQDPSWPITDLYLAELKLESPILNTLAGRLLPDVEAMIRRAPGASGLWSFWGRLVAWGAPAQPARLALELKGLPGWQPFPPRELTRAVVNHSRRTGDWGPARELLHVLWERLRVGYIPADEKGIPPEESWRGDLGNLVEACLHLNRPHEADRVIREAMAWSASPSLPAWASGLAVKAGAMDLAKSWSNLPVPDKAKGTPGGQWNSREDLEARLLKPRLHDLMVLMEDDSNAYSTWYSVPLRQESLRSRGISVLHLGKDDSSAREFRLQEGWDGRARWAVVAPGGRVKSSGEAPSTPSAWKAQLDSMEILTEINALEALLREQPERLDAPFVRCQGLLEQARSRASEARPPSKKGEPLDQGLDPTQDARIWGPLAESLENLLEEPAWPIGMYSFHFFPSFPTDTSPSLARAAHRLMPVLEASLKKNPANSYLWNMWIFLGSHLQEWAPQAFLQGLKPAPGSLEALPSYIAQNLQQTFRQRKAWSGLKALMAPSWEAFRQTTVVLEGSATALEFIWPSQLEPLVEAHLQLGETGEADRLVKDALAWLPSQTTANQAKALATLCGYPALGDSWARLVQP